MFIIKHRNIFFSISALLIIGALISIFTYGLSWGTDFKGGTVMEITYKKEAPKLEEVRTALKTVNFQSATVQLTGTNDYLLKMKPITEGERLVINKAITFDGKYQVIEKRFSSVGPVIGQELMRKGLIAIAIVSILIILFIAFAFRHVSRPVQSWKYGVAAVLAFAHDITIPTGIFAAICYYTGAEIDALFLTALLTIMTLSVNDTIVIFDRIRENLKNKISPSFEETVGRSLDETITRSLITSLTVIMVLLCLYFVGGSSTKNFALVMSLGMFFGTYSSIFFASPLIVAWHNFDHRPKKLS